MPRSSRFTTSRRRVMDRHRGEKEKKKRRNSYVIADSPLSAYRHVLFAGARRLLVTIGRDKIFFPTRRVVSFAWYSRCDR